MHCEVSFPRKAILICIAGPSLSDTSFLMQPTENLSRRMPLRADHAHDSTRVSVNIQDIIDMTRMSCRFSPPNGK